MKRSLTMLFNFALATSLIFLLACQQNKPTSKKSNKNLKMISQNLNCETPFISPNGDTIAYQINPNCATRYMEDYQNYIDDLNGNLSNVPKFPNSAQKLVYGAAVDLKELARVLEMTNPNEQETNELYLMLGIMPSDSTEIIFTLKTISKITNDTIWRYFDFTRPCPTSCP